MHGTLEKLPLLRIFLDVTTSLAAGGDLSLPPSRPPSLSPSSSSLPVSLSVASPHAKHVAGACGRKHALVIGRHALSHTDAPEPLDAAVSDVVKSRTLRSSGSCSRVPCTALSPHRRATVVLGGNARRKRRTQMLAMGSCVCVCARTNVRARSLRAFLRRSAPPLFSPVRPHTHLHPPRPGAVIARRLPAAATQALAPTQAQRRHQATLACGWMCPPRRLPAQHRRQLQRKQERKSCSHVRD